MKGKTSQLKYSDTSQIFVQGKLQFNYFIRMKVNRLKNRILFLSPTVQAGWEIQSHILDFKFLEKLGSGSFGTVHKVKHKKTSKIYAIKEIQKSTLDSEKLIEHARTQVKIMYSLNNPYIIKLYNHFEDDTSIYLVLEYAEGGQLYKKLQSMPDRKFSQETASQFIYEICLGLKAIHEHKIMHRDIKPQNILIDENSHMKVADFGWSHYVQHEKRTTFCGTLDYLAPEMLEKGHKHDYRVDIWSIGVLVFQLCTGQSPFSSELIKKKTITEELVKNNIKFIAYKFPQFLSNSCRRLIEKILVRNPDERPSIDEILAHPWISQGGKRFENEKWKQNLQNDLKQLFPEVYLEGSNDFSKEEIYNFSRPESIINAKMKKFKPKIQNQNQSKILNKKQQTGGFLEIKKLSELEFKIIELEAQHTKDQEEIRRLKEENMKLKNHEEYEKKIKQLMDEIVNQNKTLNYMNRKLSQSEKIRMEYEKKQF